MKKRERQLRKKWHRWRLENGITHCRWCGKKFTPLSEPHHDLCANCWREKINLPEYRKGALVHKLQRHEMET